MKLKWKTVKKCFNDELVQQHSFIDDGDDAKDHLEACAHLASHGLQKYASHSGIGGIAKQRAKIDDRNDHMHNITMNTRRGGRSDKKVVRAWKKQNKFVEKCVQQQWDYGDPATRDAVRDALCLHIKENADADPSDKHSNANFYNQHLTASKKSNLSQFVTRAMKRIGFSDRKSYIGQSVPDDWYEEARKVSKEMQDQFKEENADIVANAD